MKLEFILGRAGSGRTAAVFERIRGIKASGDLRECFLIVPEQATFEAERGLSEYLSGGIFGVTVTSFQTLARRMLDGLGVKRAFLSGEGRIMLVRRAADYIKKDLTVFKKSAERKGFPAECDGLISKFKRCGLTPEDIVTAAERLPENDNLRDKLYDIAAVYGELTDRCRDRFIDSEDMMNELIKRMGETPLSGAHVFIDGGDTVHEQAFPVFREMLKHAATVTAALTVDPYGRDAELFSSERFVLEKLMKTADEAGAGYSVTRLYERKRAGTDAVKHMEAELFGETPRIFSKKDADGYSSTAEGLSIVLAKNRMDEVTECAERICAAALRGVRYRDMAVIVSDLNGYASPVSRVFPSYGIPYFTDVKRPLSTHPAAQLIISALSAAERGFEAGYVVDTLKTGYFSVTEEEAERFENYLLKTGITGIRLLEPFKDEGEELENCRLSIMEPLSLFREELKGGAEERIRAVHSLMLRLDMYSQQQELCARLHEEGRFYEEEENAQVVSTILEVLDQLYVIMSGEDIGLKRFIAVVREGFEDYEVGVIPSTADQVLVGSMDRTRTREVRSLFVLGMNEGLFPKPRKDDAVIDDGDLKKLEGLGLELWQSSKRLARADDLTVYQSLSKATEEIVFSYSASLGGAGDASAEPCRLLSRIRKVFPLIPFYDTASAPPVRTGETGAFNALGRRIRMMLDTGVNDEEAARLYSWFSRRAGYKEELERMTEDAAGFKGKAPISRELTGRLYGRSIYGSASRLETFNSCPYRHFVQYGLSAKEREERREKNTDLGSFYHEALEAYVRHVLDNKTDWSSLTDDAVFRILDEVMPRVMRRSSYLLYDTARQRSRLGSVLETVKYTCCALTRQVARGSFRPVGCEISFGKPESMLPPLRIETNDGAFYISGVIDRVDETETELKRIVDYKLGGRSFDFAALYEGLQLQLPLYAAVFNKTRTVGMYYMPIKDILPSADEDGSVKKELTEKLLSDFRLNGVTVKDAEIVAATEETDGKFTVINAKYDSAGELTGFGLLESGEFTRLISFAEKKAAATLERILEGDITVSPTRQIKGNKSACRWCAYGDICLFDPEADSSAERQVCPMSAETFFSKSINN